MRTWKVGLMKIGDFPQNQIRKIAYVPPLAHARVRGGSLSLSEVKVKGCLYFVLFPSYFFLFSVSTVRLAHNQTVCQRSMSCDFPHNTADYTKTAATPSNRRTVSGIRVRPFAVVDVMTANSLYHATPQFANCGLRAAKGIVQRHSLQTVNLQVGGRDFVWEGFEGCWGQGAHFRAGLDASVFIAPRIFFARIDVSLSERAALFVRTNVSSAPSAATAFATFGVGLFVAVSERIARLKPRCASYHPEKS